MPPECCTRRWLGAREDVQKGDIFDRPPQTVERHLQHNTTSQRVTWRFNNKARTTLGMHVVDLGTGHLGPGARIDMAFYWPEADRSEGTDYLVWVE